MFLAHALLFVAVLLAPCVAAGQALEQQVKAAFLFRFLSFVEWPRQDSSAANGAPLVIGVLGAEDVRAELEPLVAGRTVRERPVVVQRLRDGESAAHVHLLFVGRGSAAQMRRLAGMPGVLLVTEWEGALEHGAVINFVVREQRVRFEVAPEEAERRGLRVGARMLAVAVHVKPQAARP